MLDLFGNHIVGFHTRRLICYRKNKIYMDILCGFPMHNLQLLLKCMESTKRFGEHSGLGVVQILSVKH